MYQAGIITASDSGFQKKREDVSGQEAKKLIEDLGISITYYEILPDDRQALKDKLIEWCNNGVDLILTSGGTGLSPRDITPEATQDVIDKEVPGISEVMRQESIKKTPHAMLTRGVSGIRGSTLIINLPGSPKAVKECIEIVSPALLHALEVVSGKASNCANYRE